MATERLYQLLCTVRACKNIEPVGDLSDGDLTLAKEVLEEIKQKIVVLGSLVLQARGKKILQDNNKVECLWKWRGCLAYELLSGGFSNLELLEAHLVSLWDVYATVLPMFPSLTPDVFLCNTIAVLIDQGCDTGGNLDKILTRVHPTMNRSKAIVDNWDSAADKTQQLRLVELTEDQCVLVDNGIQGYEEALKGLIQATSSTESVNLSKLALLEKYVNFLFLPEHAEALVDNVGSMMQIVDVRVRHTFIRVLKASVESLKLEDRQKVMTRFYKKFGVINMADNYEGFATELNQLVNGITVDPSGSPESVNLAGSKLADRLGFLFLVSGKRVLWRLFQLVQDAPGTMPVILRAFVDLKPALLATIKDENGTMTLMVAGLKRLLDKTGPETNAKRTDFLGKFVMELIKVGLVDVTVFVKSCLLVGLGQNQSIEWAMTSLSYLILVCKAPQVRIDWTNYLGVSQSKETDEDHWGEEEKKKPLVFTDEEKMGINPAPLYLTIIQLFGAASLSDTLTKCPDYAFALQDACMEALGYVGESLSRSNFEMSEQGLSAVLLAAENIHWGLRLFLTETLSCQAHIANIRHKVPICVKLTLCLDDKLFETFQCQEAHSSLTCTIESLAECSAFSGKLLDSLMEKFDLDVLTPHANEIGAHLVIAVANIVPGHRANAWRSILRLIEVFDDVLREKNLTVYSSKLAKELSAGVTGVGPVLVIAEAIIYRLTALQSLKNEMITHTISTYTVIAKERCQSLEGSEESRSAALMAVWTATCQVTKHLRDSFARSMGFANSALPTKQEFSRLQELLNDILSQMAKMVEVMGRSNLDTIANEVKVFPDGTLKSTIEGRIASLKL